MGLGSYCRAADAWKLIGLRQPLLGSIHFIKHSLYSSSYKNFCSLTIPEEKNRGPPEITPYVRNNKIFGKGGKKSFTALIQRCASHLRMMRVDSSIAPGLVFCTTGAPHSPEKPSWDVTLRFLILDILINTKTMSAWRSSSDWWELSFAWTNGLAKPKGINFSGSWCILTTTPAKPASFTRFPLFLGCFLSLQSPARPSYSPSPWLSL